MLLKDVSHKPWQLIVAGAADKIRKNLVGPGIKGFRLGGQVEGIGLWLLGARAFRFTG